MIQSSAKFGYLRQAVYLIRIEDGKNISPVVVLGPRQIIPGFPIEISNRFPISNDRYKIGNFGMTK